MSIRLLLLKSTLINETIDKFNEKYIKTKQHLNLQIITMKHIQHLKLQLLLIVNVCLSIAAETAILKCSN